LEISAILQTINKSVKWLTGNPLPDRVFMDIHLTDISAFGIFEKVTINCPIVFTTAYDEFALQAFCVNSIDYLVKPIKKKTSKDRLIKSKSLQGEKISKPIIPV
jgi:two-component system LytT family response regulator